MEEVLHIVVEGFVQGVGFRYYTESVARRLGIAGWVRNIPRGEVEILARIPEGRKSAFLAAIREGPPASHVSGLRVTAPPRDGPCPARGFSVKM